MTIENFDKMPIVLLDIKYLYEGKLFWGLGTRNQTRAIPIKKKFSPTDEGST